MKRYSECAKGTHYLCIYEIILDTIETDFINFISFYQRTVNLGIFWNEIDLV